MRKTILSIASMALLASCTPRFSGEVQLDGKPFAITACRSGQASGFAGVDLLSADGRKLRLVADPSGQSRAFLFEGQPVGADLGLCGALQIEPQSSRINSIRNIKGRATLSCSGNGRQVSGNVTFENCH